MVAFRIPALLSAFRGPLQSHKDVRLRNLLGLWVGRQGLHANYHQVALIAIRALRRGPAVTLLEMLPRLPKGRLHEFLAVDEQGGLTPGFDLCAKVVVSRLAAPRCDNPGQALGTRALQEGAESLSAQAPKGFCIASSFDESLHQRVPPRSPRVQSWPSRYCSSQTPSWLGSSRLRQVLPSSFSQTTTHSGWVWNASTSDAEWVVTTN